MCELKNRIWVFLLADLISVASDVLPRALFPGHQDGHSLSFLSSKWADDSDLVVRIVLNDYDVLMVQTVNNRLSYGCLSRPRTARNADNEGFLIHVLSAYDTVLYKLLRNFL